MCSAGIALLVVDRREGVNSPVQTRELVRCMAGFFHVQQAGDLALGKPPLRRFSKNATVGEALRALKKCNELELSLWEELCPLSHKPIKEVEAAAVAAHGKEKEHHVHSTLPLQVTYLTYIQHDCTALLCFLPSKQIFLLLSFAPNLFP